MISVVTYGRFAQSDAIWGCFVLPLSVYHES
jgi:hypothetical protein